MTLTVAGRKALLMLPLPPDELRTNRRIGAHWSGSYKVKHQYQSDCIVAWLTQGRPIITHPTHLTVRIYLGKGQRADAVDCSSWIKAGIDALTQRAWGDDCASILNPVTVEVLRDRKNPRVELEW